MYFLRSWLEEYIDLQGVSNVELEKTITDKIAEVDEIREVGDYFDNKVLIGRIENVRQHPDADKLRIFDVNLGTSRQSVQIVSAAENVMEGMLVPVALIGARLPFLTISPRKLRGVDSQGMCCGKSELMLEDGLSEGLWEIKRDMPAIENIDSVLGTSLYEVLKNEFNKESIIDIKVLPDKIAQIGNHLGMSLELAIAMENYDLLTELAKNLLNSSYVDTVYNQIVARNSNNDTPDVKGVLSDATKSYTNLFNLYSIDLETNYLLPATMQRRMFLTGRNLVGNIADLSNYLLADVGQPSHFFDRDKI